MKRVATLCAAIVGFVSAYAGLSGEYTVDPNGSGRSNFKTFAELGEALQFKGIDEDVIVRIAPGEYAEPLILRSVANPAGHDVVIDGNGQASISTYNYAVYLEGSSGVELRGLHLRSTVEMRGGVIYVSNSDGNSIRDCELVMEASGDDGDMVAVRMTSSSKFNTISQCTIDGAAGVSISKLSEGNTVEASTLRVRDFAITLADAPDTRILDNQMIGAEQAESTAIVLDGYAGSTEIQANAMTNFASGILQELTYRSSDQPFDGVITNNTVHAVAGPCISIQSHVNGAQIAFNSMQSNGAPAVVMTDPISSEMSGIQLVGNNLTRGDDGAVIDIRCTEAVSTADYNNIFGLSGFVAQYGDVQFDELAQWNEATGNGNTLSADPEYVGVGGANAFILGPQSPCIDAGPNAIALGVLNDIHGDTRGAQAEIGADEFNELTLEKLSKTYQLATASSR